MSFGKIFYKQASEIDISDLEALYDTFDKGHGPSHRDSVAEFALKLAESRVKDAQLVTLAAKLHDIGISKGREGHEAAGYQMVMEDPRFDVLGPYKKRILANAILQHRASTGKPTSVIGKIVSDADRASSWLIPNEPFKRAYYYGLEKFPEMTEDQQIERAQKHLLEKYSPGGTGRRVYFPETDKILSDAYGQLESSDIEALRSIIKS